MDNGLPSDYDHQHPNVRGHATVLQEATTVVVVPLRPGDKLQARILGRLLKMADCYRANDELRQAEEIYLTLVQDYPDSRQAQQARERLIDICAQYEQAGEFHQARSIYEHLL